MRDIKQILWTIIFMLLISGIIMQHTSNSTKNATYDGRTQNITSSIIMQHTLNGTENKTYYENIQNDIKRINTRKTSPIISIIPFLIFTSIIILYIIISLRKSNEDAALLLPIRHENRQLPDIVCETRNVKNEVIEEDDK
ncbi:uncharacterized protein [Linepithema humile]|uniref:uncharacterized protein isoform X3 n=1 Tax=Linepithema humile TaxID=83485 RepID=UPI00351EB86D